MVNEKAVSLWVVNEEVVSQKLVNLRVVTQELEVNLEIQVVIYMLFDILIWLG